MEDTKLWERFTKRFHTKYKVVDTGCWEWQGSHYNNGYGKVSYKGRYYGAHRVSFQLANNVVPNEVHHVCNNRNCVNPAHLINTNHAHNMEEQWYES